jgi:hypothetical protein
MRPIVLCLLLVGAFVIATVFGACKGTQPMPAAAPAPSSAPAPPPPRTAPSATAPPVSVVSSEVVVSACPDAKSLNIKAAREAIRRLVDPCAMIPGGSAHFSATLLPNGQVELASPSGDPAEGVVPTCVLRHRLVHQVLAPQ